MHGSGARWRATRRRASTARRSSTSDRPQAFCAGLLHPRVYVSRGALELLGAAELSAVLAHERHHARRRDPLRLASTRVLADALFFVPPLRELIRRQHSLAEIGADEAAVAAAGGDRAPLASAMLSFSEASGAEAAGLAPERIDYLVGESPRWRFPLALVLVICFCLAALVALATLVAETASGSATLALPLALRAAVRRDARLDPRRRRVGRPSVRRAGARRRSRRPCAAGHAELGEPVPMDLRTSSRG